VGGKPAGFTVASSSGNVTGRGVPAAFPSTFIGGNGNISGGTYSTWSDSGLLTKDRTIRRNYRHAVWD
jgi:hypothetical protein